MGNKVVTAVSDFFKNALSTEYVFVRYMGPKFVIAFSGVEVSGVADFINDKKEALEALEVTIEDEKTGKINLF